MNILPALIDIENVEPTVDISEFDSNEIELLAESIVKFGELIKPIVVKRLGIERCRIIEGNLEYYAKVRACELDDNHPQRIMGYIAEKPDKEYAITRQTELLKSLGGSNSLTPLQPPLDPVSHNLESDSHLIQQSNQILIQQNEQMKELFAVIKQQSEQTKGLFELIKQQNEQLFDLVKGPIKQTTSSPETKLPVKPSTSPLDIFNSGNKEEISALLGKLVSGKKLKNAYEMVLIERAKKQFDSLNDVADRLVYESGTKMISRTKMAPLKL